MIPHGEIHQEAQVLIIQIETNNKGNSNQERNNYNYRDQRNSPQQGYYDYRQQNNSQFNRSRDFSRDRNDNRNRFPSQERYGNNNYQNNRNYYNNRDNRSNFYNNRWDDRRTRYSNEYQRDDYYYRDNRNNSRDRNNWRNEDRNGNSWRSDSRDRYDQRNNSRERYSSRNEDQNKYNDSRSRNYERGRDYTPPRREFDRYNRNPSPYPQNDRNRTPSPGPRFNDNRNIQSSSRDSRNRDFDNRIDSSYRNDRNSTTERPKYPNERKNDSMTPPYSNTTKEKGNFKDNKRSSSEERGISPRRSVTFGEQSKQAFTGIMIAKPILEQPLEATKTHITAIHEKPLITKQQLDKAEQKIPNIQNNTLPYMLWPEKKEIRNFLLTFIALEKIDDNERKPEICKIRIEDGEGTVILELENVQLEKDRCLEIIKQLLYGKYIVGVDLPWLCRQLLMKETDVFGMFDLNNNFNLPGDHWKRDGTLSQQIIQLRHEYNIKINRQGTPHYIFPIRPTYNKNRNTQQEIVCNTTTIPGIKLQQINKNTIEGWEQIFKNKLTDRIDFEDIAEQGLICIEGIEKVYKKKSDIQIKRNNPPCAIITTQGEARLQTEEKSVIISKETLILPKYPYETDYQIQPIENSSFYLVQLLRDVPPLQIDKFVDQDNEIILAGRCINAGRRKGLTQVTVKNLKGETVLNVHVYPDIPDNTRYTEYSRRCTPQRQESVSGFMNIYLQNKTIIGQQLPKLLNILKINPTKIAAIYDLEQTNQGYKCLDFYRGHNSEIMAQRHLDQYIKNIQAEYDIPWIVEKDEILQIAFPAVQKLENVTETKAISTIEQMNSGHPDMDSEEYSQEIIRLKTGEWIEPDNQKFIKPLSQTKIPSQTSNLFEPIWNSAQSGASQMKPPITTTIKNLDKDEIIKVIDDDFIFTSDVAETMPPQIDYSTDEQEINIPPGTVTYNQPQKLTKDEIKTKLQMVDSAPNEVWNALRYFEQLSLANQIDCVPFLVSLAKDETYCSSETRKLLKTLGRKLRRKHRRNQPYIIDIKIKTNKQEQVIEVSAGLFTKFTDLRRKVLDELDLETNLIAETDVYGRTAMDNDYIVDYGLLAGKDYQITMEIGTKKKKGGRLRKCDFNPVSDEEEETKDQEWENNKNKRSISRNRREQREIMEDILFDNFRQIDIDDDDEDQTDNPLPEISNEVINLNINQPKVTLTTHELLEQLIKKANPAQLKNIPINNTLPLKSIIETARNFSSQIQRLLRKYELKGGLNKALTKLLKECDQNRLLMALGCIVVSFKNQTEVDSKMYYIVKDLANHINKLTEEWVEKHGGWDEVLKQFNPTTLIYPKDETNISEWVVQIIHLLLYLIAISNVKTTKALEAYDCSQPNIRESYSLVDLGKCQNANPISVKKEGPYNYNLYQRVTYQRVKIKECQVQKVIFAFHCGHQSWNSIIIPPGLPQPVTITAENCRKATDTIHVGLDEPAKAGIGKKIHSRIVVTGIIYPGTGGACQGKTRMINGQKEKNVVWIEDFTVVIKEYYVSFDAITGGMLTAPSCKLINQSCDLGDSILVWEKEETICPLAFLKRVMMYELQGELYNEDTYENVIHNPNTSLPEPTEIQRKETNSIKILMSKDDKDGIVLTRKGAISTCKSTQVYATAYDDLFVTKETLENAKILPIEDIKWYLYTNNKIDFTYQTLKLELVELYNMMIIRDCKIAQKLNQHDLILAREFPQYISTILNLKPGTFGRVQGEILHIYECPLAQVKLMPPAENCTNELKVMHKDEIKFVDPITRKLMLPEEITIVPCYKDFYPAFKIGNNIWMKTQYWQNITTPNNIGTLHFDKGMRFKVNKELPQSGLYSLTDLEAVRKQVLFQNIREKVITEFIYTVTKGPGGIPNYGMLLPMDHLERTAKKVLYDFWNKFLIFGQVISGIFGIYVIITTIMVILRQIGAAKNIKKIRGCTWQIILGFLPSLANMAIQY